MMQNTEKEPEVDAASEVVDLSARRNARERIQNVHENERNMIRQRTIEELQKVANSEERVRAFAKLMDKYGVDAIIGLFPELGDIGSSTLSGIYLLAEAYHADLGTTAYLKIIGLQAADCFVGLVPVAGDYLDYLFKANEWSADVFEQKKEQLIAKAREQGVPEEQIEQIEKTTGKIPRLINKIDSIASRGKEQPLAA